MIEHDAYLQFSVLKIGIALSIIVIPIVIGSAIRMVWETWRKR